MNINFILSFKKDLLVTWYEPATLLGAGEVMNKIRFHSVLFLQEMTNNKFVTSNTVICWRYGLYLDIPSKSHALTGVAFGK